MSGIYVSGTTSGLAVTASVHSIIDEPVDDQFLSLMKQRSSLYTSTLALY